MEFFKGKHNILYIKVASEYVPVSCLTDNSFEESADFIEKNTGGGWRSITPITQRYAISFEGIQVDGVGMSYDDLKLLKRNRTRIEWKIATDNNLFIEEGFGYISNISQNANVDDMVTFGGIITGYNYPTSSSQALGDFNNDFNNDFY